MDGVEGISFVGLSCFGFGCGVLEREPPHGDRDPRKLDFESVIPLRIALTRAGKRSNLTARILDYVENSKGRDQNPGTPRCPSNGPAVLSLKGGLSMTREETVACVGGYLSIEQIKFDKEKARSDHRHKLASLWYLQVGLISCLPAVAYEKPALLTS